MAIRSDSDGNSLLDSVRRVPAMFRTASRIYGDTTADDSAYDPAACPGPGHTGQHEVVQAGEVDAYDGSADLVTVCDRCGEYRGTLRAAFADSGR